VRPLAKRGAVDLESLRTYCQVWARWREAEDGLAKAGQLTKTPGGRVVQSPLVALANQNGAQVRALEDRLGIGLPSLTAPAASDEFSDTLTRRELAAAFGVHMMTVTKWEQDGMPTAVRGRKGKPSVYRESDVRAWLDAREASAQKTGQVDVAQERARKERAQGLRAAARAQGQRVLRPDDHRHERPARRHALADRLRAVSARHHGRVPRAGVEIVVVMGSSQWGKTAIAVNLVAYHMRTTRVRSSWSSRRSTRWRRTSRATGSTRSSRRARAARGQSRRSARRTPATRRS
jgi:hypothetical protein